MKIDRLIVILAVILFVVFSSITCDDDDGDNDGPDGGAPEIITICSPTDGFCYYTCRLVSTCDIIESNDVYCATFVGEGDEEVYNKVEQFCRTSETGDQCYSCASKTPIGDTSTICTQDGTCYGQCVEAEAPNDCNDTLDSSYCITYRGDKTRNTAQSTCDYEDPVANLTQSCFICATKSP